MRLEKLNQATVADLQIGFQNETAHQLALREVMPALVNACSCRSQKERDVCRQRSSPVRPPVRSSVPQAILFLSVTFL